MTGKRMKMTLNPLLLFNFEFEDDLSKSEVLLRDIAASTSSSVLDDMKTRNKALRDLEKNNFLMAPAEQRILNKIFSPIRQAKVCFVLGHFIGTIALCGITAEMISMLIYDIILNVTDEFWPDFDKERFMVFRNFQRLGQEERIKFLLTLPMVAPSIQEPFKIITRIRRQYLHHFLKDHHHIQEDASACYQACLSLIEAPLRQKFTGKGFTLSPYLLRYLEMKGIAR